MKEKTVNTPLKIISTRPISWLCTECKEIYRYLGEKDVK